MTEKGISDIAKLCDAHGVQYLEDLLEVQKQLNPQKYSGLKDKLPAVYTQLRLHSYLSSGEVMYSLRAAWEVALAEAVRSQEGGEDVPGLDVALQHTDVKALKKVDAESLRQQMEIEKQSLQHLGRFHLFYQFGFDATEKRLVLEPRSRLDMEKEDISSAEMVYFKGLQDQLLKTTHHPEGVPREYSKSKENIAFLESLIRIWTSKPQDEAQPSLQKDQQGLFREVAALARALYLSTQLELGWILRQAQSVKDIPTDFLKNVEQQMPLCSEGKAAPDLREWLKVVKARRTEFLRYCSNSNGTPELEWETVKKDTKAIEK